MKRILFCLLIGTQASFGATVVGKISDISGNQAPFTPKFEAIRVPYIEGTNVVVDGVRFATVLDDYFSIEVLGGIYNVYYSTTNAPVVSFVPISTNTFQFKDTLTNVPTFYSTNFPPGVSTNVTGAVTATVITNNSDYVGYGNVTTVGNVIASNLIGTVNSSNIVGLLPASTLTNDAGTLKVSSNSVYLAEFTNNFSSLNNTGLMTASFKGDMSQGTNLPGAIRVIDLYRPSDGNDISLALQRAINVATELNPRGSGQRPICIPAGNWSGLHPVYIKAAYGLNIYGEGMTATKISSHVTNAPFLTFQGFEYCSVQNIHIQQEEATTSPIVYIQGSQYTNSQSSQIIDCFFDAGFKAPVAIQLNDNSFSLGMGSEMYYKRLYIYSCTFAGLSLNGWNALQQHVISCNIAGCTNYGIYIDGATVHGYSVGFQNGYLNKADVFALEYAADRNTFRDCRSESAAGPNYNNSPGIIESWITTPGFQEWKPNNTYAVNDIVVPTWATGADGQGVAYVGVGWICTTPGTSGATEPAWPPTSAVITNDGTVNWKTYDFNSISANRCLIQGGNFAYGRIYVGPQTVMINNNFTRPDFIEKTNFWNSAPICFANTVGFGATNFSYATMGAYGITNDSHLMMGNHPIVWSWGSQGKHHDEVGFGVDVYASLDDTEAYAPMRGLYLLGRDPIFTRPPTKTYDTKGLPWKIAGGSGRGNGGSGDIEFWAQTTNSGGSYWIDFPYEKRAYMNYSNFIFIARPVIQGLSNTPLGVDAGGQIVPYVGVTSIGSSNGIGTNTTIRSKFAVNDTPSDVVPTILSTNAGQSDALLIKGNAKLTHQGEGRIDVVSSGDNYSYFSAWGERPAFQFCTALGAPEWMFLSGGYSGRDVKLYNFSTGGFNQSWSVNGDVYIGNADPPQGTGRIITKNSGGIYMNPGMQGLNVSNNINVFGGSINVENNINVSKTLNASNLVLTVPAWKDIVKDPNALSKGGIAVKQVPVHPGTVITVEAWENGSYGDGSIQFNHDLAITNAAFPNLYIQPHVHIAVTNIPGGTSTTTWKLDYIWAPINDNFATAVSGSITNTLTFTAANQHYTLSLGNITNNAASGTVSSVLSYRLSRINGGAGDVGAELVHIHDFDIHYPVNRLGSSSPSSY